MKKKQSIKTKELDLESAECDSDLIKNLIEVVAEEYLKEEPAHLDDFEKYAQTLQLKFFSNKKEVQDRFVLGYQALVE